MYNCIIAFFICYDAYKEYENTSFSLIFISIRYEYLFFENLAVHLHFFISYKIILIISWRI